jgi:hypothetical protein
VIFLPAPRTILLAACFALCSAPEGLAQGSRPAGAPSEIDAFMQKVLARREVNRQTLKQYILDEVEEFEILGPGRHPLHRTEREFTWYLREGVHVRSPRRFNGVGVDQEARDRYERNWLARERNRLEKRAKKEKETSSVSVGPQGVEVASPGIAAEPRFVSESYFMDFKFEPGNYFLAGKETLDGQSVLKIDYLPSKLFNNDHSNHEHENQQEDKEKRDTRSQRQRDKEKRLEQDIDRKMNKSSQVTLWVDPASHQIVRYTFDNVWLDFLPAGWIVRIDDLRASMQMGQPFPSVWLPKNVMIHAGVTLALGSMEVQYKREFSNYRKADVTSRVRVPKDVR